MMVALLALFVALTGGAYAAAKIGAADIAANAVRSNHIRAKEVKLADLGTMARFRRVSAPGGAEQAVLRLGGLTIGYRCIYDGLSNSTQLTARTTVDNALVDLGFTTGSDGFGSSHFVNDGDFDKVDVFDLDRGRYFGRGTLVYSRPGGTTVSVTYGFHLASPTGNCYAHAVATGG
jgi:hypothetical protein